MLIYVHVSVKQSRTLSICLSVTDVGSLKQAAVAAVWRQSPYN